MSTTEERQNDEQKCILLRTFSHWFVFYKAALAPPAGNNSTVKTVHHQLENSKWKIYTQNILMKTDRTKVLQRLS